MHYGSSYENGLNATVFVQHGSFVAELEWEYDNYYEDTSLPTLPTPQEMSETVADAVAPLPS
jgi:hypothetical protein